MKHDLYFPHRAQNLTRASGLLSAAFCCLAAAAEPFPAGIRRAQVHELLAGYLSQDAQIHRLTSELTLSTLRAQETDADTALSMQLSSGTVTAVFGSEAGTSVQLAPSATVTMPAARGIGLTVSSSIDTADAAESHHITDGSIAITAGITPGTQQSVKARKTAAQRNMALSRRSLRAGFLSAEQRFYKSLRSLYSSAVDMIDDQNDAEGSLDKLEKLREAGKSQDTVEYRLARAAYLSDCTDADNNRRALERGTRAFAQQCSAVYEGTDALAFLPFTLPQPEPLDAGLFDRASYLALEDALYAHQYNTLVRSADSPLTVTGTAGCTAHKKIRAGTYKDTVDTGITVDTGAVTVTGGISVPTDHSAPVYTLGLSLNTAAIRTAGIRRRIRGTQEEQELTAISDAEAEYDRFISSSRSERTDLQYAFQQLQELYEEYRAMAADAQELYHTGAMTERAYRRILADTEQYRLKSLMGAIDIILYNSSVRQKFAE